MYSIQFHADRDLEKLRQYWGRELSIDAEIVRVLRKPNSGRLGGRSLGVSAGSSEDRHL
jgi:hypothetical protein